MLKSILAASLLFLTVKSAVDIDTKRRATITHGLVNRFGGIGNQKDLTQRINEWIPVNPSHQTIMSMDLNGLLNGRDSNNASFRHQCEQTLKHKIFECNQNENKTIKIIPSNNLYVFLLDKKYDRMAVRNCQRQLRVNWRQNASYPRRDNAVVSNSNEFYFMATKVDDWFVDVVSYAYGSIGSKRLCGYQMQPQPILLSWKDSGYSVRDIKIFKRTQLTMDMTKVPALNRCLEITNLTSDDFPIETSDKLSTVPTAKFGIGFNILLIVMVVVIAFIYARLMQE